MFLHHQKVQYPPQTNIKGGHRFISRRKAHDFLLRNIMGCSYRSHMISIILFTFFILMISLSSSNNSSIAHSFHGLQKQFFFMEPNVGVEKVASLMHKFRTLLGLKSLGGQKGPTLFPNCVSPAPAAAPLSPAPVQLHHAKPLSLHPRARLFPHHHHETKKEDKDEGRVRRILVPTLVSAGFAVVAFVLGFVCLCGKRGRRDRSIKSKHVKMSTQISSSQVRLNPNIDLLYLDAIAMDLEQQDMCFKPDPDILNASSEQVLKPGSENGSSSSTKEIMSVHNDDGGGGGGDRIIPADHHSSDDESFHSFTNSHSSNFRISNASAGSLSDITAEVPQNEQNMTLSSSQCHFAPSPPPPPPPPLVPRNMHVLPPKSSPMKMRSKDSETETNPELSTREKEDEPDQESEWKIFPDKTAKHTETPSVIPAPPFPTPFLKDKLTSSSTAVNRIPPPPCPLPQHAPLGKDGAPLAKLKPLHWDKVRATPDRTTVWDKLRSSSFELDEGMIESLFRYNAQSWTKNEEGKSKTPSPTKHVLESKRLQNMTILSKALNVTAEQVCNALIKGTGLGLQQLEALVRMVPTKEEEAKLLEFKGDINELGSAEKFIKLLIHCIPSAFLRAEAMLYRETFEDEVVHLKNSFSMLEEACKELRSSRLFLKLLEAVLKTGNRMNVGTIRGGARAFKLDALLKLSDVKGTDGGKTTLLHFVVQEIIRSEGIRVSDSIMGQINQKSKNSMRNSEEEREEDYRAMGLDLVSGLSSELYHVKKTASLDLDVLGSSVSNLSDGMMKLNELVNNGDDKNGSFVGVMKGFIKYGERKLEELKGDEDRVLLNVREIREYFHGDLSKEEGNPLRIFVIVRDFLGMLDHVCKELRSLKVASSPNPLAPFR